MTNFGNIKPEGRTVPTAEVAIEGLDGLRPVLVCKPASEENPPYFNELSRRLRRGRRNTQDVTTKDLKKIREIDADLLPKYCIVGFVPGTVIDADGKEVEFSTQAAGDLIRVVCANARDSFDDFRADLGSRTTFTEFSDDEDVVAQAGNSPAA